MLTLLPWQMGPWRLLQSAKTQNKLHHALLLTGPEGTGLTQFANLLSASLLCHQQGVEFMCGNCKSCILYKAGNHPDIMYLTPEEEGKTIRVDLVRELIVFMQHTSQYGRKKIAIIDPAESMNRSSANSLLKTLEEPPADTLFILNTHQPGRLPVTVRSRCQRLNFAPSYTDATLSWLKETTGKDEAELAELLDIAQGAPLRVLQLLEQDALGTRQQLLQDLVEVRQAGYNPVKIAEKWQGLGAEQVLRWLISIFRQMTRLKLSSLVSPLDNTVAVPYLQALANELNLAVMVSCYDQAVNHYQALTGPYNLNALSVLEDMILYWQSTGNKFDEQQT